MDSLHNIKITVNENVYVKDPESSELGRRIIQGSILLIHEIGFEAFTFKKLGAEVGTTEASIYRYFVSKHHLLVYLTLWYWGWMEYRIILKLTNIDDPTERLKRAIHVLTEKIERDTDFSQIDEVKLNQIVVAESSKVYLNKQVDRDNSVGFFKPYKELVHRIGNIILEINPNFKYPHMLVSTIIEGAHHQHFFAEHLPRLTDIIDGEDAISNFYTTLAIRSIQE